MRADTEKQLSIYVHIPFCKRKCNYCDFLSFCADNSRTEEYFRTLYQEIELSAAIYTGYKVRSIFFGGGTPSVPDSGLICRTLSCIRRHFDVCDDAEISIEVNPQSAIYNKLLSYRQAGFNRISIGAQSMNDSELKRLGRLHNSDMFKETFFNARKAGFENINVDVMSALPDQSLKSYLDSLEKIADLSPEHISAYSLIVEEGTPFYDMDLDLPMEDEEREMYHRTKEYLKRRGYHRYEISNYALGDTDRYECYHNKVYWKRGNYLGVGLGAASMVENVRWSNTRDINRYTAIVSASDRSSLEKIRENTEVLSIKAQMEEYMFLGLRLIGGISYNKFRFLFGRSMPEIYGGVIDKYVRMGLLEPEDKGDDTILRLTDTGLDVSNTVMADFLF